MSSWSVVKTVLKLLHRWVGLVLAPVFLAILVSGAVLAFRPILADGSRADGAAVAVDPAAVIRLLERADPRGRASVVVTGDALVVTRGPNRAPVAFDLRTGEPAAVRARGFDVFRWAERLHRGLLIGAHFIVEIASYALLAIIILGPFLAWPRFNRTVLGWHIALGWVLFPLALLTPLTGVLLILHVGAPTLPAAPPGPPVTPAGAIERVAREADLSGLVSARVFRGRSVLVTTRAAGGDVSYVVSGDDVTRIGPRDYLVRSVHFGVWAGAWSGLLNLLSALVLIGLTATGAWSWFLRRRDSALGSGDADADVLVAFASQTGTAASLAKATFARLRAGGERAALASLAALDPAALARYRHVLVIASTAGEGEPPDMARPFLRKLQSTRVEGTSFALLGLGDSRYPKFCAGAETIRRALLAAGAHETAPTERADGPPSPVWERWLAALTHDLGLRSGQGEAPLLDRPVTLTLAAREQLNDPNDPETHEAWKILLASERPLGYRPGDLLLIAPDAGEPARPYSIASTALADPKRIELTVGLVTWTDAEGREKLGAVSGRLCRSWPVGQRIAASVRSHADFNLPDDATRPLIMVCAGCGMAPFVGFLAELDAAGRKTPTWLIFGNRRSRADFFHRDRLEDWRARRVLTRLDTAFSRDPGGGRYVQDRIVENGAEFVRWMVERDAILFVCGRASTLRAAIDEALASILIAHAGLSRDEAAAQIDAWVSHGKLRRDLFD